MFYYSLKTKTEEHCLEPRIFGGYDYGIYDLSQNLLKKKKVVTKEEAVEFIYKTQKKLGGTFIKMDMSGDEPKIVEEKKAEPIASPVQPAPKLAESSSSEFKKQVAEELASRGQESVFREEKRIENADGTTVNQSNHALKCAPLSKEEYEENKDKFRLIAELNHNTGLVSVEVQSIPHEDATVACDRGMEIIDKLLRAIVQTFPELVDNHFISAGVRQTGESYEDFTKGYRKQSSIPLKARSRCLTAIQNAVENYRDITK